MQAIIAVGPLRAARRQLRVHRGLIALGAIAVAIYPLAFYSSMHLAGVAVGSVVSLASAPLASGLLERIVERRRLSRWWVLAAGIGVVGSTLLCLSKLGDPTGSAASTTAGILLALVAVVLLILAFAPVTADDSAAAIRVGRPASPAPSGGTTPR